MLAAAVAAVFEKGPRATLFGDATATFDPRHAVIASWIIVALSAALAILALALRLRHAAYSATTTVAPEEKTTTTLPPSDLPLVREKEGARSFSWLTRISFYISCRSLYHDVWHKFNKQGLAVLVPTLGARKEIFLPHSSMKWAVSQPARVLGMWDAFQEMFQLSHSLGDDKFMIDTWPHMLLRRVLTQELDDHLMDIHDELPVAIDTHLGLDTEEWRTVNLLEVVRLIVGQTGSRFTVGPELGRNQNYLRTIISTVDSIVANAGATAVFPQSIRSFMGKIICFPTFLRLKRLATFYRSTFAHRIELLNADAPNQPVDLLQKFLRFVRKNRPQELATDEMTRRMCMANLAFIYLASFSTTHMISNILDSDAEHDTIATLRAEAEAFIAAHPDPKELWRRQNTQRMVRVDSVMRETLRLNTLPTRAIVRQVKVDGLTTDTGLPVPNGSLLSFISQPYHTDPERFHEPNTFDPYRFSKLRETEYLETDPKLREDVGGDWSRHSFLSTADLLVFGRGKNSCPGRLLMEIQLKMLLSYLLRNYNIRLPESYKGKRKQPIWALEFIFPDSSAKVEIRRRKGTTSAL